MVDFPWEKEPDLAELSRLHTLLKTDPNAALMGLEQLVGRGSIMGALYIADTHKEGKGIPADIDVAEHWYKVAKSRGLAQASHLLGCIYYRQEKFNSAFEEFQNAAANEYLPSKYRLAKCYCCGIGTQRDDEQCLRLLEEATKSGHIWSKRMLASYYVSGRLGRRRVFSGVILLLSLIPDLIRLMSAPSGSWVNERIY